MFWLDPTASCPGATSPARGQEKQRTATLFRNNQRCSTILQQKWKVWWSSSILLLVVLAVLAICTKQFLDGLKLVKRQISWRFPNFQIRCQFNSSMEIGYRHGPNQFQAPCDGWDMPFHQILPPSCQLKRSVRCDVCGKHLAPYVRPQLLKSFRSWRCKFDDQSTFLCVFILCMIFGRCRC